MWLSGPRCDAVVAAVFRHEGAARSPIAEVRRRSMAGFAWHGSVANCPPDCTCGPAQSYTREPAAELHTLGSPPLLGAVVQELTGQGAFAAGPGEFTLRAFLAGRIDLTQAEAVLGVIDARGEHDLQGALRQLAGGLSRPLAEPRESADRSARPARSRAGFRSGGHRAYQPDRDRDRTLARGACRNRGELGDAATRRRPAHRSRWATQRGQEQSVQCALRRQGSGGQRAGHNAADYLTARLDLDGICCELVDTAGVEPAPRGGPIEHSAQDQTAEQFERAHLKLLCFAPEQPLTEWQRSRLAAFDPHSELIVLTKADQSPAGFAANQWKHGRRIRSSPPAPTPGPAWANYESGWARLALDLERADSRAVAATAARAAASMRAAATALERGRLLNEQRRGDELVAAEACRRTRRSRHGQRSRGDR